MKPVKHLFASTNKLANVPELKYKRRVPHSPLSPKTKEKHNAKLTHDKTIEPMVLRSPPTVESIIRYALPIPSSKTKELIAEGESIRKITKRLKMVAYNLEKTYGFSAENGEQPAVKAANEELTLSIGDDLNSSLVSTSQFAAELDETVKEEQTLLESVFKWFQQQVNQMEEINKDQDISEAELPASKNALLTISQIIKQVRKLKELKNRLTHRSGTSLEAILSKSMDIENTPDEIQRYEIMQQKIQEFIKTHSAEANVDVREAERPTDYSLNNQFDAMLKIFEKQSDALEKTVNEQDLLETKYKQMESDFQVLSEEKFSLENELQKLKNSEKTKPTSTQTKKTGKAEKKKDKGKHESSEEKKFLNKDLKSKDFQEMQQAAYELAIQNKFLHEKLKQALQEAERAKNQLSYFLNEGRDLLKSEGKHKATQERKSIGKIQVEDSEKTPLEEETIEALVTDLGGLKTNDTLQEQQQLSFVQNGNSVEKSSEKKRGSFAAVSDISQFPKSQEGSAVLKDSLEVSSDENQSQILSSKHRNKLVRTELPGTENAGSLPAGTLLQENETVTASLNLPPIKRKQLNTDNTTASVLKRKTKKQTYQEAGQIQAFSVTQQKDTISTENQLPEDISLISKSQAPPKNLEVTRNEEFDSHVTESDGKLLHENQDLLSKSQLPVEKQETPSRIGHTAQEEEVLHEIPLPMDKVALSKSQSQTEQLGTIKIETPDVKNEAISEFTDTAEILPSTDDQILDLNKIVDTDIEKRSSVTESHTLMAEMKTEAKRLSEVDTEGFTDGIGRGEIMGEIKKQSKIHSGSDDEDLKTAIEEIYEEVQLETQPLSYPETDIEGFTKGTEKSALMEEMKTQSNNFGKNVEHWAEATGITDANGRLRTQPLKLSETDIESSMDATERGAILEEIKTQSKSYTEMHTESFRAVSGRGAIKEATKTSSIYPGSNVEQLTEATQTTDVKKKLETQPVSLPETDMERLTDTIGRGTIKEIDIDSFTDAIGRGTVKEETEVQSEIHPESDVEVFVDAIRKSSIKKTDIQNFVDAVRRGSIKETDMENFAAAIRGGLIKETDIAIVIDTIGSGSIKEETKAQSEIHPGSNVESLTDVIQGTGSKRQLRIEPVTLPGSDIENFTDVMQGTDAKEQFRTQPVMLPETNIESFPDATGRDSIKETDLESFADATGRGSIKETDLESFADATGRGSIKETDLESFADATGRGSIKETDLESFADATGRGSIKETDLESFADATGRGSVKETDIESFADATGRGSVKETDVESFADATGRGSVKETDLESFADATGRGSVKDTDVESCADATGRGSVKETDLESFADATGRGSVKETDLESFADATGRGSVKETDVESFADATGRGSVKETDVESFADATGRGSVKETDVESFADATGRGSVKETDVESFADATGRGSVKETDLESFADGTGRGSIKETDVESFADATGRGSIKETDLESFADATRRGSIKETDLESFADATRRGSIKEEIQAQSKTHPDSHMEHLTDTIGGTDAKKKLKTEPLSLTDSDRERVIDATGRGLIKEEIKTQSTIHPAGNEEHFTSQAGRTDTNWQLSAQPPTLPETDTKSFTDDTGKGAIKKAHTKSITDDTGRRVIKKADKETFTDIIGKDSKKEETKSQSRIHPGSNVEHLTDAIRRTDTKGQLKTKPTKIPEADTEHFMGPIGRGAIRRDSKIQSKSHLGISVEHLTGATRRTDEKGQPKTLPLKIAEANTEYLPGIIETGATQEEIRIQSKSHHDPDREDIVGVSGRVIAFEEMKTQSKSHPGLDFSKPKNIVTQQQDAFNRHTTLRKFPTKVINFSPFNKEEKYNEEILFYVTDFSETLPRRSHDESGIYKATHLPSMNKELPDTDIKYAPSVFRRGTIYEEFKIRSKGHLGSNVEHLTDADARRDKKIKLKRQSQIVPEHYADVTERSLKHAEMKAITKSYLDSLAEQFTGAIRRSSTLRGETKRRSKSHFGSKVGYATDTVASTVAKDHPMTHALTHPDSIIEQFTDAIGRDIIHGETKKASKSHLEHYVDVTERAIIPAVKERSRSHIDSLLEKLTEMIARATPQGETKKQPQSHHDSVMEQFAGAIGRGVTHGETRKASKSHPGPGIENFPRAIGRGKIQNAEKKAQPKGHLGSDIEHITGVTGRSAILKKFQIQPKSHLVKTSYKTNHMLTQHQDLLVRNIPQHQFPTKVTNFSLLGKEGKPINAILNQQDEVKNTLPFMTSTAKKGTDIEGFMGAIGRSVIPREMKAQPKSYLGKKYFKTKHMNIPHQDSLARDVTRQFPAKVINLSPFSKEENYEYFSHYMSEHSKLLPRRSRNYSSIDRATYFHSLNKEHLGQPNNGILKQQNEHTNTLPVLISAFKVPIYVKWEIPWINRVSPVMDDHKQ